MKILMILDHVFPPDTRVENEIASLAGAGHEVHIACFAQNNKPLVEKTPTCTIHRKKISKFTYKSSVGALKLPFYFHFWRKFVKELFRENSFDVIHIHDLPLAKIGLEAKKRFNVNYILDLHENWPVLLQLSEHTNTFLGKLLSSNRQWIDYERDMCRKADEIIVVVDEAKNRIANLGVDKNKIYVVSNTLDINQFDVIERKGFNKENFRILYVGGINYHRGIQYVIDAIYILKQKNISVFFDLVGDGRYLNTLRKQIVEKNVEDRVVIHGFKKYTQIPEVYENANLAIIPHVKSGHTDNTIPHKIFQYLYAEIPILTSNCDPLERIVNETHSGISYQYDNSMQLAEIIEDLYKNPEKLNDYIHEGRKAVIEKYNWSVDGAKLIELYSSII
ncbi:MAG: glycosyltransferase family 4 protein [Bacteroidales bacterium]|nr:glycosyltransferase family 4 protein [Bacteroidales bacterium]